MQPTTPNLLLHGFDTIQCCYYLSAPEGKGIDAIKLATHRESQRIAAQGEPSLIEIGGREFFLSAGGSRSGYPFVLSDADYRIEYGPRNNPSFFVHFRSEAIWTHTAQFLHHEFLRWASELGYVARKPETLTRADFCFDFAFDGSQLSEDHFVSLSNKDSQYRANGQIQTFTFGKGDVVLRVYDKVAEIREQSHKVPRWPLQIPPLMAAQIPPGRTR